MSTAFRARSGVSAHKWALFPGGKRLKTECFASRVRHAERIYAPIVFSLFATVACFAPLLCGEDSPAQPAVPPSWQATGWGGGGFYWACAFHPAKDGVIYLGGDCNGVYKTEDHGKNWRIINRGISDYAIYSIATDALHPDTVFAVTTTGVCKSVDAGEHWEFLDATGMKAQAIFADRGKSVRALAVDPQSGDILAGTPHGIIYKSSDGGKTWKKLYELKEKGVIASVAISSKNGKAMLAASNNAGLLMSADGGETWTPAAVTAKNVKHAAFAPSDDAIIYAACANDGVWKSTDHGQTWSAASTGIDPKSGITEVVIDPQQPDAVCAMATTGWSGNVYRSTDGGKSWKSIQGMKPDKAGDPTLPAEGNDYAGFSSLTNIAVNPNNGKELYVAANWRCAYSADGGATWEERDRGTDISCITDIRFLDGKTYVTVMDEGLLASDDNGSTWKQLYPLKYTAGFSGHHWRVFPSKTADGAIHLVSTCSAWDAPVNKIMLSADGGKTFKSSMDGLPKDRPKKNTMWGDGFVRALAADPANPQTLYVGIDGDPDPEHNPTGGGIFKSTDGGVTWKQLAHQPGSRRMFYGLAVDPTDSKRIFWGSCGANGGLYRSEDSGDSWTLVCKDEPWVFNLAVSATGEVYCAGNNLWHSADHGATWKKISDFKDGNTIVGLELHPKDEKTIWISRVSWSSGASGGIYKTTDAGAAWQDIAADIPYRKPLVLRFNPDTSELWAGNVGLYKLKQ